MTRKQIFEILWSIIALHAVAGAIFGSVSMVMPWLGPAIMLHGLDYFEQRTERGHQDHVKEFDVEYTLQC